MGVMKPLHFLLPLIRTDVTLGCGNRETTDSRGSHTFQWLPNGTYALTPAKTGCSGFTPQSRTVTFWIVT